MLSDVCDGVTMTPDASAHKCHCGSPVAILGEMLITNNPGQLAAMRALCKAHRKSFINENFRCTHRFGCTRPRIPQLFACNEFSCNSCGSFTESPTKLCPSCLSNNIPENAQDVDLDCSLLFV